MEKYSKSQQEAITHHLGPCLTLAGPGSGKTLVITLRTKHLIEHYGVAPADILVVTFTKAAAVEMRTRFLHMIGKNTTPVTFGTFHSVFFMILKYAYHYSADNIIREEQKFQIMKELVRVYQLDYEDENEYIGQLLSEVSAVKNGLMEIEHYYSKNCPADVFRKIFQKYQSRLTSQHLIDFDDMLVYTYELFSQRKDILALWQQRYPFILVDEYQDINPLQYKIISMMAAPKNNLFVVGDDDQSIYRFRGAAPQVVKEFTQDYPGARQIVLDINYRCNQEIVEKSLRLICHNKNRFQKEIRAASTKGRGVEVSLYDDQRKENLAIIDEIRSWVANGGEYQDIAILFRTNTQPRMLMGQLMEYNIPFKSRDQVPNLYDHWIARDIMTYLRLGQGSRERSDILQIMNRPKRYIGRDSLDEPRVAFDVWADYYYEKEQDWIAERVERLAYDCKMLGMMAPYAALNYIRKGIGYEDYLREYAAERQIREDELLDVLDELHEESKGFASVDEWNRHIVKYREELQLLAKQAREEQNRVSLSTYHSAKGLEYKRVYLIDVNEKLVPYKKAVLQEDIEEERRMFYVGMTRAKESLRITYVKQMKNHEMQPSRFLEELR